MFKLLTSYKKGNIVTYHSSITSKEKKFDEYLEKSDEFSIIREIGKTEEFLDNQGNIIDVNFYKKEIPLNIREESSFYSVNNGLYKDFEEIPSELKDFVKKEDFEDSFLIVSNYLSSSGSNHIGKSNAFINEDKLNITHIINVPFIGTCDMKNYIILTFINNKYLTNDYIVRFIEKEI